MLDAMSVIDSDAAARSLARAILADIQLYSRPGAGESAMTDAVAEGRSLFQRRVDPALHGVFEQALDQSRLGTSAGDFRAMPHEPVQPRPKSPPPPRSNTGLFIGLAIVVAVAAIAWFFVVHGAGPR
jgi:hypothetical protein